MFTGIIETVGSVTTVEELGGGRKFTIEAPFASELRIDQSISVNGTCLTVVAVNESTFQVEAVEETLAKTTLGNLSGREPVNLERAMRAGDRFDGHLVQGHVDGTGVITGTETKTSSWLYHIRFDAEATRYIIPVGSIAVDGISLTVADLQEDELTVSIIPHTYEHTNVSRWATGTEVNLEYDMIGKYVARQIG
jgi:riboflavin synthase